MSQEEHIKILRDIYENLVKIGSTLHLLNKKKIPRLQGYIALLGKGPEHMVMKDMAFVEDRLLNARKDLLMVEKRVGRELEKLVGETNGNNKPDRVKG